MSEHPVEFDDLMLVDEPSFQHVMECVFGIQDHEIRTFFVLAELPGSTVAELADHLERDRSNVNRSLATLHDKGLVERERRLLDGGGYVYQYYTVTLDETKNKMHQALDEWTEDVHERIDEFGHDTSEWDE